VSYANEPANTLIVSPDNTSRRELNRAVRQELKNAGVVDKEDVHVRVLAPRQDMTGADRNWASRYAPGDILRYSVGSKMLGLDAGAYARVIATNAKENLVTVQKESGEEVTYNPKRLKGISAYRELTLALAAGDGIQFTNSDPQLAVSNRELATISTIQRDGQITASMDDGRMLTFDPGLYRHFDHGYAVTSHSSQGLTAERVLVNADTNVHPELLSSRFVYVAVSRGSEDVRLFTDNFAMASNMLSIEGGKSSAMALVPMSANIGIKEEVGATKHGISL
jgi:hypothetical protein